MSGKIVNILPSVFEINDAFKISQVYFAANKDRKFLQHCKCFQMTYCYNMLFSGSHY